LPYNEAAGEKGGASMADLNPRITVDAGKMGGKPCIRGMRFTVYDLASYLASGMTEDEILTDFPYLEKEDFQAVYEFFASIPERVAVLEATR
jgi:uncharacterized protein (DUF433 family)